MELFVVFLLGWIAGQINRRQIEAVISKIPKRETAPAVTQTHPQLIEPFAGADPNSSIVQPKPPAQVAFEEEQSIRTKLGQ